MEKSQNEFHFHKTINPVKKIPLVPSDPSDKILVNCGVNMYVNPKTKRCVQLKNKDVQKYLKNGFRLKN